MPETSFPVLPAPGSLSRPGPRRIAIASVDIAGPYHCGGVGAAYQGLALALAEAGHEVTVVYLHPVFHQGDPREWIEYFRRRGIRFVHLPKASGGGVWYGSRKEASLGCYRWLREQAGLRDQPAFDVIHFHDWLGLPYYSLIAKRLGLAFAGTTLCVGTHGPMRWSRLGEEALASSLEDLVVDFMERKSVELADVVVSPSQHLLQWMRDDGWTLPQRSYVSNNILQPPANRRGTETLADYSIRELVFFGRLERRKGLAFFCDVVDRLRLPSHAAVTFLGSDVVIDRRRSLDYLRMRAASWAFQPLLLTTYTRTQALEYLGGTGRLAVMPSQMDNSPCTVQECLEAGIPFLASDRGGIPELVHPDDLECATAPLELPAFAARLEKILRSGQRPARAAPALRLARDRWIRWHDGQPEAETNSAETAGELPFISVCIAHYERPRMLDRMLASLRAQTYSRMEVIVVDDGSTTEEARSYLAGLGEEFSVRGWQLLRQDNAGPGIARDRAARAAQGSYLLFADDDDELVHNALETFAHAAGRSGADALSCVLMEFEGAGPPPLSGTFRLVIPLGSSLAAGLINPEFGGTLYMLRRECYFAAGGFSPERDVDEDWELLLNVVAHGFNLQVIPEPLVWYRKQAESRSRANNRFARNRSRVRIYEKLLPFELRDMAALVFARLHHVVDADSQQRMERVIATLEKVRKQTLPE